jgi:hypothetical protein
MLTAFCIFRWRKGWPAYFAGKKNARAKTKYFGGAKVGLHISVAQSSACIFW